jgi:flagellar biosynthetic protein FliP
MIGILLLTVSAAVASPVPALPAEGGLPAIPPASTVPAPVSAVSAPAVSGASARPLSAVPALLGGAPSLPLSQTGGVAAPLANLGGGQAPWTIIVLLTLLTLIPALLLSMTPFVRLLIVFHFLRQALGTQSTPTNQTLIGLALVLTFFLMQPVGLAIQQQAIAPLEAGRITPMAAVEIGSRPLKTFMLHYARQKDVALFLELAKEPRPVRPEDLSMRIVMPSYILSELKAGFQIGAVLFLPFLVIDMVVASITTSVGMMQLPPVVISTPLKLLLFVMVDGWNLLVGSLMRSFA